MIDSYLVEHEEDDKLLNQYYQNSYHHAEPLPYNALIYQLAYNFKYLRANFRNMIVSTVLTGGVLAAIHPALPLVLSYDAYLILKSLQVMNQTCEIVMLHNNKREVILKRLNFLGFQREAKTQVKLSDIRFLGKVENTSVLLDNYGLLPSLGRTLRKRESVDLATEKNNFRYFLKFVANNESFLVAVDHEGHDKFCLNNELLHAIIQGKQKFVMEYDYSK